MADAPVAQPQLPPYDLRLLEQASLQHDAVIAAGVTIDQVLAPAFWAHHGTKLAPFHEIRARAEDGTWMARLVVLDCSRTWAKVHLLSIHHFTTGDVAATQASEQDLKAFIEAHQVIYRGPHKWSVLRKADRAVLTEGIEGKDDAAAWLTAHAKQQISPGQDTTKPVAVAA